MQPSKNFTEKESGAKNEAKSYKEKQILEEQYYMVILVEMVANGNGRKIDKICEYKIYMIWDQCRPIIPKSILETSKYLG